MKVSLQFATVTLEAKHCNFECLSFKCTAENIATRGQILTGTSLSGIRNKVLKYYWDLSALRQEGMGIKSETKGAAELTGTTGDLNKIGKYSRKYNSLQKSK